MERYFDIAIVGAGPAGLAASISAKAQNPDAKVVLLEKMKEPAKKLSASGNGRGNLSNKECASLHTVLDFFSQSGIATRMDDEGRIYPYSEEAKAVAAALTKRAKRSGVTLLTDSKMSNVEANPITKGGFRIFVSINGNKQEIEAQKLLIATGGKSFAIYGSTGDGQGLAKKLGHQVKPLIPALTAIEVKESLKSLKGVRAKARVSLFAKGNMTFEESGEVQFREDCVSGICIMNMSSNLPVRGEEDDVSLDDCKIMINFVPEFSTGKLMEFLKSEATMVDSTVLDLLETLVKKPVAVEILKRVGISDLAQITNNIDMADILKIANELRGFSLSPCGRKGWKEAQVTKGGIALSQINPETMESKIVKDLYFAGEIIDYDGPCGGYNLHNAWLTGIKAGRAMSESLK